MEVLNSLQKNQLSFVISSSMYQDPQQIRDSLKIMWNKNYDRLHFLFRVEYLDANSSRVGSIVSEKGQDWGYLSLSSDLASLVYGSFAGHLPSNLLAFFHPVFEAVAQLRGTKLTRNPRSHVSFHFKAVSKKKTQKVFPVELTLTNLCRVRNTDRIRTPTISRKLLTRRYQRYSLQRPP